MEALQFDQHKKTLSLVKTDVPTITENNEVLVKVVYAGVCGTDLHIIDGIYPCKNEPFTLGHEFCGVVSSIGSDVKHVKCGDRVVVDPNSGCGVCKFCARGDYHHCPAGSVNTATGVFNDGGWAQFCKVAAHQVHHIPDGITFEQAVLCEPLSCICHAWDMVSPLTIGSTVLVAGAGIIGTLWACLLHHSGHRKVIVTVPMKPRRTLNPDLHTGYQCLNAVQLKALKTADPQWGVDVCVDCSGNSEALQQGLSLLLPGGKLCIFGVANPETTISICPFEIFRKELTIVGTLINQFSFHKALGLIEAMGSRYLEFKKLGVKVYSLEQHQEAIQALKKGTISKAIFKVSPGPD